MDTLRFQHAVLIGGTGMLRDAVVALSRECHAMTLIARQEERLAAVTHSCECDCCCCVADWHDTEAFITMLRDSTIQRGPVDLVLAWIHTSAGDLPLRIARLVADVPKPCRYIQIYGSGNGASREKRARWHESLASMEGIAYRRIVLGAVQERGTTRWLTDDEISRGVTNAVLSDHPDTLVGDMHAGDSE